MSESHSLPINIQDHLRRQQNLHPEATGALTSILGDFCRVSTRVSYIINRAGLAGIHGATGSVNVQGEKVLRLDALANEQFKAILRKNPHVAGYASEEEDDIVPFSECTGRYVVSVDPLDGSSNFDKNISIGSIFAIYRRLSDPRGPVELRDFLQKGREQICAGYFLNGTSTMLVYTTGEGVYGFTLDNTVAEFVLPEGFSRMQIPEKGKVYSVNEGNSYDWSPPTVAQYVDYLKRRKEDRCGHRYVGSLVADFHRSMIEGGIYTRPTRRTPKENSG